MTEQHEAHRHDERTTAPEPPVREPLSPWTLIGGGAVLAFLGVRVIRANEGDDASTTFGLALIGLGGALALVALVEIGVLRGLRRQRWRDGRA